MITTSSAWKDYAKNNSIFHIKAVLTSTDGTVLNLTDEDFMMGSVSLEDATSDTDVFTIGSVITNKFSCTLNNTGFKFEDFSFGGATIAVQFGIIYEDNTEEWIDRGIYTIEQPYSLGSTIDIEAYDFMDRMNAIYDGKSYIPQLGANLFDESTITIGWMINKNGTLVDLIPFSYYSDYIAVTDGEMYAVGSENIGVMLYDSSKNFLGCVQSNKINRVGLCFTASIDSGTVAYIRKNGFKGYEDEDYVKLVLSGISDIVFPIDSDDLVNILTGNCGVDLDSSYWQLPNNLSIDEFEYDETTTCRQVLGWILQINGGYGRINENGELVCKWYEQILDQTNLFTTTGSTPNAELDIDGNVTTYPTMFISPYIAVNDSAWYYSSQSPVYATTPVRLLGNYVFCYDSSKNLLGKVEQIKNENFGYIFKTYIDGETVAYIRLNVIGNNVSKEVVCAYPTAWEFTNIAQNKVSVYNIHPTGVSVIAHTEDTDSTPTTVIGTDGYMLELSDNPLITESNMDTIAQAVYDQVDGLNFSLYSSSIWGDPSIEAGDLILVSDYRGRQYASLITAMSYRLNGLTDVSCGAETPENNSNQNANPTTQAVSYSVTTAVNLANNYSNEKLQEAKDYAEYYTDTALTKRAWAFTETSTSTIHYNDIVVNNGVAMGGMKFKFNSSGSGWRQLGTTTDIPHNDITVPLINLSAANWLGELQVRTDGTVQAYYASTYANDAFATIVYDIS